MKTGALRYTVPPDGIWMADRFPSPKDVEKLRRLISGSSANIAWTRVSLDGINWHFHGGAAK
jgi:hypothetical protein